ncbi:DUF4173 domain-containing protein [Clostridium sp. YIM B02515]|uniref:DUF4173 domain-containing protein n=1 Tax=Clostridium rhizosphaerae TaxID=2803861 RepID=A0ABS1TAH9_9CLOT|nr:DUF4173 domain-containing protein [Clostridium rhizosphaerae]MBL4935646.1 DUF4173 domain-containing protein [Clostridium rhizosphaerae]
MEQKNSLNALYCIIISLTLGIIFDKFFFNGNLGVSYFIFIALCITFFLWSAKSEIKLEKNIGWFLMIPIALLALSYTVYTNPVFMVLNFLAVPALMIISSVLIYNPKIKWDKISFVFYLVKKGIVDVLEGIGSAFNTAGKGFRRIEKKEESRTRNQIIIGLVISIPIIAIVIMLLSSADMIFNYYLNNITRIFDNIDLSNVVPHIIMIGIVTFYLLGYVWSFKIERKQQEDKEELEAVNLETLVFITVLTVMNVLYLIFTLIQFSYLYGGEGMVLPSNFTYAEYARRGFFELVAVTIINFVIILGCLKYAKKENEVLLKILDVLLSVLILFTVNMLYSANFKLSLYESSFGYTYQRVFVHLFMILLFILCIITFAGIWNRKIPVMKSIIITTVIAYTIANYLNIDVFIAKKNIERYYSTGKLDAQYLTSLSYEAVPLILDMKNIKDISMQNTINEGLKYKKEELARHKNLGEFNFSRRKVQKLFENNYTDK